MDSIKETTPKFTIYAHANRGIGHVWFSLTDNNGAVSYYEISPDCKSFYKKFRDARDRTDNFHGVTGVATFAKLAIEGLTQQIMYVVSDRNFIMQESQPEKEGRNHDVKVDIDLNHEQLGIIRDKITEHLEGKNNKYQLLGHRLDNSKQNCVSNILEILNSAGINLEDHLPSGTWVERVSSPASFVLRSIQEHRSGNPNVSVSDKILEKGKPETFIYKLTEMLDSAACALPGGKC